MIHPQTHTGESASQLSGVEKFDLLVSENAVPYFDTPAIKAANNLTKAADQPPLLAVSVVVVASGLILNRPQTTSLGIRMLTSTFLATKLKNAIKSQVNRTRPHAVASNVPYRFEAGNSDQKEMTSFPSGHTAAIVAASLPIVREYPQFRMVSFCLTGLVGGLRVARGKHYLSDVTVGAAIGIVSYAASKTACDLLGRYVPTKR
ncbi:membrane-associated phospholipid phosphatase [Novosphingobium gossypii]